ncbi:hypothetical protein AcV5_009535 [Taiwanofungus camphoratus]|nr:hypothetical protein AcV5_009535 [Antrodia cinnamomea]
MFRPAPPQTPPLHAPHEHWHACVPPHDTAYAHPFAFPPHAQAAAALPVSPAYAYLCAGQPQFASDAGYGPRAPSPSPDMYYEHESEPISPASYGAPTDFAGSPEHAPFPAVADTQDFDMQRACGSQAAARYGEYEYEYGDGGAGAGASDPRVPPWQHHGLQMKCEDDVGQHAGSWCAREASQLSFDAADQDADYPPGEFAAGPLQPEPAAQAYDAQLSPYAADALADCGAHALTYDLPDRDDPMAPHEYAPLPGTAYIHGHYVPFRGDAPDAGSMSFEAGPSSPYADAPTPHIPAHWPASPACALHEPCPEFQHHRSYTLAAAITPVQPTPAPAAVVCEPQSSRPPMGRLPSPDPDPVPAPAPAHAHAPVPAPAPQPEVAPVPAAQPNPPKRPRGRPRKKPVDRQAAPSSPRQPVAYPFPQFPAPPARTARPLPPPFTAPGQPLPPLPPARPQTPPPPPPPPPVALSLDEVPLSERDRDGKPGQAIFKLNAAGATREPPKKKPIMACLFCRERKIACGPPVPGSADPRCNQCARRSLVCEYPKESRRGQHKRGPRAVRVQQLAAAAGHDDAASAVAPAPKPKPKPKPRAGKERGRSLERRTVQRVQQKKAAQARHAHAGRPG